MPPVETDIARVRAIVRSLHRSSPEAATAIEEWIDLQEARIIVFQSDDPVKALVLALADSMSRSNTLVDDVRNSMLVPLARAEAAREERRLQETRTEAERVQTVRGVLSQPAVIAVIGVLSTVLTGIISLVQALLEL